MKFILTWSVLPYKIKNKFKCRQTVQTKSEWKTVKLTCSPLLFVEPVGLPFTLSSQEKKCLQWSALSNLLFGRKSELALVHCTPRFLNFRGYDLRRQPEQKVESSPSYLNSCPRNPFKIKSDLSKKMYYHLTKFVFSQPYLARV